MFRKAGYATAAIGKLHVHGETRQDDLGFDVRAHRLYTYTYEDYVASVGKERVDAYLSGKDRDDELKYNAALAPVRLEDEYMQDSLTTTTSIDFIRQNKDRPFFVHVGLEKPHPPWTTQGRFLDLYNPAEMPLPPNRHEWWENDPQFPFTKGRGFNSDREVPFSDDKMKHCIAAYYACISEMDGNVGKIMHALRREDLLEKTVIVFASDHGDNLFEHGLEQKHCFYEGAVAVPLIISGPEGRWQGGESSQFTSLIDIMPTLAEITHVPVPADADGCSLVPAMQGKTDPHRAVFSEFHEWVRWPARMIRLREWKYIYYHGHTELLFNLDHDPGEMQNLAEDPEHADICAELKRRVLSDWSIAGLV